MPLNILVNSIVTVCMLDSMSMYGTYVLFKIYFRCVLFKNLTYIIICLDFSINDLS
jgi:hypothetical protein